jgi:hypothetical protein
MLTDPNTRTGMSITGNGNLRVLVPTYTQTQPFRLTRHMYLLCTVNMAGCQKIQQNNFFFLRGTEKLVDKAKTSPSILSGQITRAPP